MQYGGNIPKISGNPESSPIPTAQPPPHAPETPWGFPPRRAKVQSKPPPEHVSLGSEPSVPHSEPRGPGEAYKGIFLGRLRKWFHSTIWSNNPWINAGIRFGVVLNVSTSKKRNDRNIMPGFGRCFTESRKSRQCALDAWHAFSSYRTLHPNETDNNSSVGIKGQAPQTWSKSWAKQWNLAGGWSTEPSRKIIPRIGAQCHQPLTAMPRSMEW